MNTVVKLGEPVLIGTGLDKKVRKKLLEKMIGPRKHKQVKPTHVKIALF